jgi:hypothetical protein
VDLAIDPERRGRYGLKPETDVMPTHVISSWELRLDPDDKQKRVFFKIDVRSFFCQSCA